MPAMLAGTIDFYHFMPLSVTLTLFGSQGQPKAKPLGFIFSYTFQLIRVFIVEAIQGDNPDTVFVFVFEWNLMKQGNWLLFYWQS